MKKLENWGETNLSTFPKAPGGNARGQLEDKLGYDLKRDSRLRFLGSGQFLGIMSSGAIERVKRYRVEKTYRSMSRLSLFSRGYRSFLTELCKSAIIYNGNGSHK